MSKYPITAEEMESITKILKCFNKVFELCYVHIDFDRITIMSGESCEVLGEVVFDPNCNEGAYCFAATGCNTLLKGQNND